MPNKNTRSACEQWHVFNTGWCATSVLNTWSLRRHQQQHKVTAPHRSLTTAGRYDIMSSLSLRRLNPLPPQYFHCSTKLRSCSSAAETSLSCSFCFTIYCKSVLWYLESFWTGRGCNSTLTNCWVAKRRCNTSSRLRPTFFFSRHHTLNSPLWCEFPSPKNIWITVSLSRQASQVFMFFFFFFFAHNVRKGQEMIYKSFTSPGVLPTWIRNRTSYLITYLFIHKMLPGAAFRKTTET